MQITFQLHTVRLLYNSCATALFCYVALKNFNVLVTFVLLLQRVLLQFENLRRQFLNENLKN